MTVKSKLSKLLSWPLNSDKIDEVYDHLLITQVLKCALNRVQVMHKALVYSSTGCLKTMTSPEEHSGLGSREPNILERACNNIVPVAPHYKLCILDIK